MRPDALLSAVARAEGVARLAYIFAPGGYTADVVSAIASVRAAVDAPDWTTEFERWREEQCHERKR
jgi:hypothetical protein